MSLQFARMNGNAAIILSSGPGQHDVPGDCAAEGFSPLFSLSFDYGQRHRQELMAAKKIAQVYEVKSIGDCD